MKRKVLGIVIGLMMSLLPAAGASPAASAAGTAPAPLQWDWLSPLPQNHLLNGVIYAGGQFVAVGDGGAVITSTDGQAWDWHPSGADTSLQAQAYGDGRYVAVGGAVGGDGAIITSTDGVAWTRQARVKNVVLTGVAYGAGRFIAVGTEYLPGGLSGVVLTSGDGLEWSRAAAGLPTTPGELAYGRGLFVVLNGQELLVSPDGQTWTARPLPVKGEGDSTWGQRIIYTGTEFALITLQVVDGERSNPILLTSPDAETWTAHPAAAPGELFALAWDGARYVAAGSGGTMLTSADGGDTWSSYHGTWAAPIKALACGGGRCAGVGAGGGYGEGPTIISTKDLVNWAVSGGGEPIAYSIAYGSGRFVAVRGALRPAAYTSADGLTWTRDENSWLPRSSVVFQGNRFVAGSSSGNGKLLLTSADGLTWQPGPDVSIWAVNGIAFGKGRYVVGTAGGGIAVFSSDLQPRAGTAPFNMLLGVAYGKGLFVGAGLDRLSYSEDGFAWTTAAAKPVDETRRTDYGADFFRAVAYGAGRFVAVGGNALGYLFTSPDGKNWRQVPTDTSGLLGVIYGGGRFLAWSAGTTLTSEDGETWTAQPNRAGAAIFAYGAGRFVAVGPGGTLMAATVCGTRFSDVGPSHPDCDAIEALAHRAITSGNPDGTFRPGDPVTRAEAAKWLVLALGLRPDPAGPLPFTDTASHWAARDGYLQTAASHGLIGGYPDRTFRPDQPVTRAELVKMIAAAAGVTPEVRPGTPYGDIAGGEWFAGWVSAARGADLVGPGGYYPLWTGDRFQGNEPATRGEAARLLENLATK